ncbi:TPA: hypothetical protein N0F65_002330 [Lagenidium giganteum]|uniref:Uncharacterized protein n=1 Tax=Lagenidium giganteum TaxID=4803 RepID=A0AAV2Z633_9STRA|nr:TPA: hypothetical protein N0F65_002330 [Lagenidium giganteum]
MEPAVVTMEEIPDENPHFWLEFGSLAIVVVYGVAYFVGKSQNKAIANKWLDEADSLLQENFAYTGNTANPKIGLLEEAADNFKYYCTGRRYCTRFVADLQLASRHDLLARLFYVVKPTPDYLTIDVGLGAADMDPFIFAVSNKLKFTGLTKLFPELLSIAKRIDSDSVPSSLCLATDSTEILKLAMNKTMQTFLTNFEPFLDYVVVTDVNSLSVVGLPNSEKRLLHLRLKLQSGNKILDSREAVNFTMYLIDAIGATFKLSRDAKRVAQNKRAKLQAEEDKLTADQRERLRRQNEIKEKKKQQYESLSYEEQQRRDELQEKKKARKRLTKVKVRFLCFIMNLAQSESTPLVFGMELNHALIRAPVEQVNKAFRLLQKQVTKELMVAMRDVDELHQEQKPAQRRDINSTIATLTQLAERIQRLKRETQASAMEQQRALRTCVTRVQYIKKLDQAKGEEDVKQLLNDRIIADYLLSRGHLESAKIIKDNQGIEELLDEDLHVECHRILQDLQAHCLKSAIAWCSHNGSRLRRLPCNVEFQLRLQEFIELVRANQKLEAIQYAQAQLTPIAMQHEDEAAKKAAIEEIQEAMATLAYKVPEQCGVESYARLFEDARWTVLQNEFRKAFSEVYCLHDPPALCVTLHAGLSSLNTRTCHRTRESRARARIPEKTGSEDEDSECSECMDEGACERGHKRHKHSKGHQKRKKHSTTEAASLLDLADNGNSSTKRSGKRKHSSPEVAVPLCPTCSEIGGELCAKLPFAHHPLSRLVCRVTRTVMDEHNPPLVLPNGYVYSQQAVAQMTQQSERKDTITCIETREVFAVGELRPVYIL